MRNLKQEHDLMTDILNEVDEQYIYLEKYRKSKDLRELFKAHDHECIVKRKMIELHKMQEEGEPRQKTA